ncbi:MAG: EscU/YscU/HrcU family type III secretion system export apparatus switch protein [Betaproteobacteria bacterium]
MKSKSPEHHAALSSAAALAYHPGEHAPRLLAKGRGLVADEIIRRAQAAGIYVHESRELVSLLMQIDLDRHIPPQLYVAVAELLAWLHGIESGNIHARPNLLAELRPCPN